MTPPLELLDDEELLELPEDEEELPDELLEEDELLDPLELLASDELVEEALEVIEPEVDPVDDEMVVAATVELPTTTVPDDVEPEVVPETVEAELDELIDAAVEPLVTVEAEPWLLPFVEAVAEETWAPVDEPALETDVPLVALEEVDSPATPQVPFWHTDPASQSESTLHAKGLEGRLAA